MITYNHAPYIRQALDSVLMQKRDFPIEICLGEDQSTDGTREICQEYAARHPDIIRLFLRDRADPARGRCRAPYMHNCVETLRVCRGLYVALMEGDDYWTDPLKLSKQVAYMEANPQCSVAFHNVRFLNEDGSERIGVTQPLPHLFDRAFLVSYVAYLPTTSAMLRNTPAMTFPAWWADLPYADWPLFVARGQFGDYCYMADVMGVYRLHGGGVWSNADAAKRQMGVYRMRKTALVELRLWKHAYARRSMGGSAYETARCLALQGKMLRSLGWLLRGLWHDPRMTTLVNSAGRRRVFSALGRGFLLSAHSQVSRWAPWAIRLWRGAKEARLRPTDGASATEQAKGESSSCDMAPSRRPGSED